MLRELSRTTLGALYFSHDDSLVLPLLARPDHALLSFPRRGVHPEGGRGRKQLLAGDVAPLSCPVLGSQGPVPSVQAGRRARVNTPSVGAAEPSWRTRCCVGRWVVPLGLRAGLLPQRLSTPGTGSCRACEQLSTPASS